MIRIEFPKLLAWFQTPLTLRVASQVVSCAARPLTLRVASGYRGGVFRTARLTARTARLTAQTARLTARTARLTARTAEPATVGSGRVN